MRSDEEALLSGAVAGALMKAHREDGMPYVDHFDMAVDEDGNYTGVTSVFFTNGKELRVVVVDCDIERGFLDAKDEVAALAKELHGG